MRPGSVRVLLFGAYRDAVGAEALERELPAGASVDALWAGLCADWPALAGCESVRLNAVNQDYVDGEHQLAVGDELAFFPPVSGG